MLPMEACLFNSGDGGRRILLWGERRPARNMRWGYANNMISAILKLGTEIPTYQRRMQIQTAITRMSAAIIIIIIIATRIESLTFILDRVHACILPPYNTLVLFVLRSETLQRDCIVQQAPVRLVVFNPTVSRLCADCRPLSSQRWSVPIH